jgi:hypothetical protein
MEARVAARRALENLQRPCGEAAYSESCSAISLASCEAVFHLPMAPAASPEALSGFASVIYFCWRELKLFTLLQGYIVARLHDGSGNILDRRIVK